MSKPKLLLATNNPGKIKEYRSLLQEIPFELVTPSDEGISMAVEEGGETYEENARLKATAFATRSGLLTLADDSGLEVDALGGEPGHMSARYAGDNASDQDRINYLLSRLNGVPQEKRTARFRCVIALGKPSGEIEICSGECYGIITLKPSGERGFGYDPVFYFPELRKTMAELPLPMKNQVSHRGQAARAAVELLRKRCHYDRVV